MLSSKIRTTITVLAATTALSAAGVTGIASAAPIKSVGLASRTHVLVLVVHSAVIKEAGSAGVAGYGDDTCQALANDYNTAVKASEEDLIANNGNGQNGELANRIYGQLTSNCLVVE